MELKYGWKKGRFFISMDNTLGFVLTSVPFQYSIWEHEHEFVKVVFDTLLSRCFYDYDFIISPAR